MNPYIKNWIVSPLLWASMVWIGMWAFSIEASWRVWAVCVWACIAEAVLDYFLEGRPMLGPRRWE